MATEVLSVVTRLHTTAGPALDLLSRALLSLVGAQWSPVEPIIVAQQFSEEEIKTVERLVNRFDWEGHRRPKILNYRNPSPGDHRTALLNLGIREAGGRYLAFLDYDDYVYEHAHQTLIGQLRRSRRGIAFGLCVAAYAVPTERGYKITHKDRPWAGKTVDDFLTENIFPPNSFVIDRARLPEGMPLIDERLTRLEDYFLLLKLRAVTTFDMTCFDRPLCEYVLRQDGTTTYQLGPDLDTPENIRAWRDSRDIIKPTLQMVQALRGRPEETLASIASAVNGSSHVRQSGPPLALEAERTEEVASGI